jgi:intracellular sulfur oxidation DsrE/DsrF family protein
MIPKVREKTVKRLLLALAFILSPVGAFAAGMTHHVAFHLDENDPALMNLILNNAQNVSQYYASVGDEVEIEIVAYGPGLSMYLPDSPVKDRIAQMSLAIPTMTLSACGNTMTKMAEKAGHEITLLPEARVVPAGVVRLIELQEAGWSYIRP